MAAGSRLGLELAGVAEFNLRELLSQQLILLEAELEIGENSEEVARL